MLGHRSSAFIGSVSISGMEQQENHYQFPYDHSEDIESGGARYHDDRWVNREFMDQREAHGDGCRPIRMGQGRILTPTGDNAVFPAFFG